MSYKTRQEATEAVFQDRRRATTDETRSDAAGRQALGAGRRAYVLVNNRAEGNAPLTVQALAEMVRN